MTALISRRGYVVVSAVTLIGICCAGTALAVLVGRPLFNVSDKNVLRNEESGYDVGLIGADRCGVLALSCCLRRFGQNVHVEALDHAAGRKQSATSMHDLNTVAAQFGLTTLAIQWNQACPEGLLVQAPAVLPVVLENGRSHFVACLANDDDRLLISDVPYQPFWIPMQMLRTEWKWDGTMLHVFSNPAVEQRLREQVGLTREARNTLWVCCLVAATGLLVIVLFRHRTIRK